MITIYKYTIHITDRQAISLPTGARILTAQMQGGNLCLWVRVDTDAQSVNHRTIFVYGTGRKVDPSNDYIATVQQGVYVWHVFVEP